MGLGEGTLIPQKTVGCYNWLCNFSLSPPQGYIVASFIRTEAAVYMGIHYLRSTAGDHTQWLLPFLGCREDLGFNASFYYCFSVGDDGGFKS